MRVELTSTRLSRTTGTLNRRPCKHAMTSDILRIFQRIITYVNVFYVWKKYVYLTYFIMGYISTYGTTMVATPLRCGEICYDLFIASFPMSLRYKNFWKSVSIWRNYGHEFGVLFFGLTAYYLCSQKMNTGRWWGCYLIQKRMDIMCWDFSTKHTFPEHFSEELSLL